MYLNFTFQSLHRVQVRNPPSSISDMDPFILYLNTFSDKVLMTVQGTKFNLQVTQNIQTFFPGLSQNQPPQNSHTRLSYCLEQTHYLLSALQYIFDFLNKSSWHCPGFVQYKVHRPFVIILALFSALSSLLQFSEPKKLLAFHMIC